MRLRIGFHFAAPWLAVCVFSTEAQAYLDPGTGSLIVQILFGAIFAAMMTAKLWWFRAKAFVGRLFRSRGGDAE